LWPGWRHHAFLTNRTDPLDPASTPARITPAWSLTTERFRKLFVEGSRRDGYVVEPPTSLDPRATPHPLACFLQAIKLSHDPVTNSSHRKIFVYLSAWRDSPFASVYERLRSAPDWELFELKVGHDVMAQAPDQLFAILRSLADGQTPAA